MHHLLASIPQPPPNLTDWLVLLGLIIAMIEGARRRLVIPLLDALAEHAYQHELVAHELIPNGNEHELPPAERESSLRLIAIRSRVGTLELEKSMKEHRRYSVKVLEEINRDRVERGLPPINTEGFS